MESFVFKQMNKASRDKDVTKMKYYGPLATALSYIVHCSNKSLTNLSTIFNVYRGLKVSETELAERFQVGAKTNLQGFTSSTLNRSVALKFTIESGPAA